jgi:hypothetical protein
LEAIACLECPGRLTLYWKLENRLPGH